MRLKCIGGICDGITWDIDNYYKQGDCVRVGKYPKLIAEIIENFDPNKSPEFMKIDYHIYIVDVLKYDNGKQREPDEIWFLRPTNFTTFDAIQFQFLKV